MLFCFLVRGRDRDSFIRLLNHNMAKQKLVLKIGAPCSGKGAFGKAVRHLHGNTTTVLTMRDLIDAEKTRSEEFRLIATSSQSGGSLIDIPFIKKILKKVSDDTRRAPILFLDGAPRCAEQVGVIKHLFHYREIYVIESVASDERLLQVFLDTMDADDRADREDAEVSIHHGRVKTYRDHLPYIRTAVRQFGWDHYMLDATYPLSRKIRKFEAITQLAGVHRDKFVDLEKTLGLPDLKLVAA